jgi:hypothetical protein
MDMRILSSTVIGLPAVAVALWLFAHSAAAGTPQRVRQPAVAGTFYPADPKELAKMVDDFISRAAPPPLEDVVALVAPHAGYPYSGPVAAWSYALLKGRKVQRVVVIAPSHYEAFGFSSVYDGAAYATPLGQVAVDQAFAAKLARASPRIRLSDVGHRPLGDRAEHALEVQLPFLQRTLGDFQLVPIVMGDQSYESSRALGVALAELSQGSATLIVASSDLSHYHPYGDAVKLDRKTLGAVEAFDYLNLSRNLERQVWEACGGGPIVAVMIAAERLGASQAKLLKYANSGDTAGDRSRVVGYGAVAFVQGPPRKGARTVSLSREDKDALLVIARKSVENAVRDRKIYECSASRDTLLEDHAAFVTLTKRGELRGCIGYVTASEPLYLTVRDAAMMAALRDTRFPPVTAKELPDLEYEISVLSPMQHILDIREIRVGQHGLLIRKGEREGILLPQVALDQGWDRMTFLEELCFKAGLPRRAWLDPDTDIFSFTAVVFGARPPVQALIPDVLEQPTKWPSTPAPGSPARSTPPF